MQTFSSVFERHLVAMIKEEIGVLAEQLVSGSAVASMEDYRRVVGKIEGLRMALELCEPARAKADGHE